MHKRSSNTSIRKKNYSNAFQNSLFGINLVVTKVQQELLIHVFGRFLTVSFMYYQLTYRDLLPDEASHCYQIYRIVNMKSDNEQ